MFAKLTSYSLDFPRICISASANVPAGSTLFANVLLFFSFFFFLLRSKGEIITESEKRYDCSNGGSAAAVKIMLIRSGNVHFAGNGHVERFTRELRIARHDFNHFLGLSIRERWQRRETWLWLGEAINIETVISYNGVVSVFSSVASPL